MIVYPFCCLPDMIGRLKQVCIMQKTIFHIA